MNILKLNGTVRKLFTSLFSTSTPCSGKNATIKEQLIKKICDPPDYGASKITIVGLGAVGHALGLVLTAANVATELCLIDKDPQRACAQVMDLQHVSQFLNNVRVYGGDDYALTADSRVCIVTAGVATKKGASRLSYTDANAKIVEDVVKNLMKYSKETILLMISNPVDIMTYVAWKVSGLPMNMVFGTGTTLESSRFKTFLSQRLNIAPRSVHAMVIGEHGDSCVPVWSGVHVCGTRLKDLNKRFGKEGDPEDYYEIKQQIRSAAHEVINRMGFTAAGPALTTKVILDAIFGNSNRILPVSTCAKGFHSIKDEVFLSLPCVLNNSGIVSVVKQQLSKSETKKLQKSAQILYDLQSNLSICKKK